MVPVPSALAISPKADYGSFGGACFEAAKTRASSTDGPRHVLRTGTEKAEERRAHRQGAEVVARRVPATERERAAEKRAAVRWVGAANYPRIQLWRV